jgi:two-component system response regulator LytT
MYRIAICEDEKYILEELHKKLEKYIKQKQMIATIKTFMSGEDLLKEKFTYDIILLDMVLPGINGLEVAKKLFQKSCIIFITFYEEYALDAFEVDAIHYLIKPVTEERLYLALDRAIGRLEQIDHKTLTLVKGGKTQILQIQDILYCEVFNHQIIIHTLQNTYNYSGTLDMLEKELDGRFFRCHRSFIINMDFVVGKEEGVAIISNGDKILISRRKQSEFMQKLLKIFKRGEI